MMKYKENETGIIRLIRNETIQMKTISFENGMSAEVETAQLRLKTKIIYKNDAEYFKCPIIVYSKYRAVERPAIREHRNKYHAQSEIILNILQ